MKLAEALDAKSYLEVGVFSGATFLSVDIERKVAVDPNFRFEVGPHEKPNVSFHRVPSDEWFSTASGISFDIIFLDGLHEFGQTFRDFCASQAFAQPGTVWIIDDTVPNDIFSALPTQREAIRLRREAGGEGGHWHGDVYKVVFAIADFFPSFNFCTVQEDNPQTFVWHEPRPNFRPRFNSLERIERLSYIEFLSLKGDLRFCGEEEGIGRAIAGAKKARDSLRLFRRHQRQGVDRG